MNEEDPETLQELLDAESRLVLEAEKKYGPYWVNAFSFGMFLHNFIKEVSPNSWLFTLFLSQVKKHHTLALTSFVRRHQVQGNMNLRQVIEAATAAAYALAHTEESEFYVKESNGTINEPESLRKKRYKWLATNYKKHSDFLLAQKQKINEGPAHSSVTYASSNFALSKDGSSFETSFFDQEDDFHIKLNLWFLGNLALGIVDLFAAINKDHPLIIFVDDFVPRLVELEKENHRIKAELGANERVKRWLPQSGLLS